MSPTLQAERSALAQGRRTLLRLATAGSVDDGKSTLVGRLLFDFNTEFETATPDAATFAERFSTLLAREDVVVLLSGEPGEETGFAFLTVRPTPYYDGTLAQLEELYVVPDLRDGGIGTALLTTAVAEVRALVENAHHEAWEILVEYRDVLDDMVLRLLDKETLSKDEIAEVFAPIAKRPPRAHPTGNGRRPLSTKPPVLTPAELAVMGPADVQELEDLAATRRA